MQIIKRVKVTGINIQLSFSFNVILVSAIRTEVVKYVGIVNINAKGFIPTNAVRMIRPFNVIMVLRLFRKLVIF